jgi:hypothetical protein
MRAEQSAAADSTSLRFEVRCANAGIAMVDVALQPRTLELRDDQVAEYLDEIGADVALRARWAEQRGKSPWVETYTKFARLGLAIGDAADDAGWRAASGRGDELVAQTAWSALRGGADLEVVLLHDGQPVGGIPVGLRTAGRKAAVFATTDAEGRVRFGAPGTGPVLLHATRLEAGQGGVWRSRFVTLAFEIAAP